MDTFHGIGAVEAAPINPLHSQAFLRQAWQRRTQLRPQLWLWSLAMVPLYVGTYSLREDSPWFAPCSLLASFWCLYCCHRILKGAYVRLSQVATPSTLSVFTGYAAAAAAMLVPILATATVVHWRPDNPGPALLISVSLVLLSCSGLWLGQFFVGVATVEGRGFGQDLRKAVSIMWGNHREVSLAFVIFYMVMYALFVVVFLAALLIFGMGVWLLKLAHCPPFWETLVAGVPIALVYFGGCFEIMAALLSLHVCSYWELRSRLEPLAEGQGLK